MRCFISLCIFICLNTSLFSQRKVNRYVTRAGRATENGKLEKARDFYIKALTINKNSFKANAGLGITLFEFMDKPEEALPYLEAAYKNSLPDTLPDLIFALAKCYQHHTRYKEALEFYAKLAGVTASIEDNNAFQLEIKKRKEDCAYGSAHQKDIPDKNIYVVNIGSKVNSQAPEYVPVITPNNELIFTSKRKDSKREKLNYLDGKYFESMYISKVENGRFAGPRRYTVPDMFLKSKFRKHSESIISMSPDGKKLFIYRDAKIFEIDMDKTTTAEPKKLAKTINFDYYQNHAYLSKDGKVLMFTSEAEDAVGGIDIYQAEKIGDGVWSKPKNIGKPVNTIYDEDAPFLSDDGKTLYFASKGHPGFGNFDMYKSALVDGKWTEPVNLGKPINSPAHDIFLVQESAERFGYFSSARVGGYGDMDIYKINYLDKIKGECPAGNSPILNIAVTSEESNNSTKLITANLPSNFTVYSYAWKVNEEKQNGETKAEFKYRPKMAGDYIVSSKLIAFCDTCLDPYVACNSVTVSLSGPTIVTPTVAISTPTVVDLTNVKGPLNKDQANSVGIDISPLHFSFNSADLKPESEKVLAINLEVLKAHPELSIEIIGYADNQGTEGYNKKLSQKRAEQVKAALVKNGLDKKRILKVEGKGETNFVVECADCDAEQNEKNRRVEFTVIKQ
jgi:outer membrane protein OmpA-like peptidoglycan-associated protein/tetratricopeptide (TPR) repeat protein